MAMFFDRGRGWLAAAALAALGLAAPARAQYAPYGSGAAQYAQPQQQQYSVTPTATPTQQPQYAAQGAYQGYAAAQPGYAQAPTAGYAQAQPGYGAPQQGVPQPGAYATPQTGYAQPQYGAFGAAAPRVAMAFNNQQTTPTAGGENLPLTPPVEQVPAGTPQNGGYVPSTQPAVGPAPVAMPEQYGAPAQSYGNGYETYPSAGGAGCATGNCNTGYAPAPTAANGYGYGACDTSCNTYSTYGGMGGILGKHCGGGGYWFGGAYGLLMDRDNSNKYALAFVTDPSMPTAYPPADMTTVLTTRDADIGFQPGVEFRLGRAFGGGGCGCGCGPTWGIEAVYWTLFEDDAMASYDNPTGTSRTYTMMPMYGLEYSHPGTGMYMPMNEYWDHGMPSQPANTIRVDTVRVRSQFEVQNLELNLLRMNLCGGGCGAGGYGGGYGGFGGGFGSGMGGGCCDGGCDTCATGACTTGCAPRGPRYSCTAVCGVRWMEFNESFMFGVDYTDINMPSTSGMADYWATVENNLIGAQIGCNGMYRIGCRWGLHLNTLVGVYANDINTRQYFSSTGDVRFIGTGEDFDVMADKTDVAMLGELRIGASYQATCHWRLYGGWRAIGVTGIALATDQSPNAFLSAAQMNNYVNSNGSLILHGLQTGVEFNY